MLRTFRLLHDSHISFKVLVLRVHAVDSASRGVSVDSHRVVQVIGFLLVVRHRR